MLTIKVPAQEVYNSATNLFTDYKESTLSLEHSLVSISKWESKWHKPFYAYAEKTREEVRDYIRCMTIGTPPDDEIYERLSDENVMAINDYILNPMTATTFSAKNEKKSREVLTSEVIYYLMFSYGIPMECQKWHINRLMTLIKVFEIKNNPKKQKMSKSEILNRNRMLNAQRRAAMNSKG